jgi:hypothetical protein
MRQWSTGAVRDDDDGKPRYDLIPALALRRVAHRFADGAKKYGEDNWQKGIPRAQILASAMRHLEAWRCNVEGRERIDDEDHLAAVTWGMLVLMQYEEMDIDVKS